MVQLESARKTHSGLRKYRVFDLKLQYRHMFSIARLFDATEVDGLISRQGNLSASQCYRDSVVHVSSESALVR